MSRRDDPNGTPIGRQVPLRAAGTRKAGEGLDATLCTRRNPMADASPSLFFTQRIKQTFANEWRRAVIELKCRSAEAAEAELTRFIERRHDQRRQTEGERREEDLWMETVRAHQKREREYILWERLRYHEAMVRAHTTTHETIIARHRAEVERCEALLGINETKGAA